MYSNSLLVLQDDLYESYLHGIEERSKDVLSEKNIINADTIKTR